MREFITDIETWFEQGKRIGMATVVQIKGSSPRPVGAKMIVSSEREMFGSVSGGCVESNVIEEVLQCIMTDKTKLLHYGISEENPWNVGLACGGEIDVFVEPLFNPAQPNGFSSLYFTKLSQMLKDEQICAACTALTGEYAGDRILFSKLEIQAGDKKATWFIPKIHRALLASLEKGKPDLLSIEHEGKVDNVFVEPYLPKPRLIIIGAVHIASALVNYARGLGFKTIVCDPRSAFLTSERFPTADLLIHAWPEEAMGKIQLNQDDCFIVLSHDEKIDVPALMVALKTSPGYIGLLGSRKTRDQRFEALRKTGISNTQLGRIHAPIGLNLGAIQPEEIALAIIAEIIANRNKREYELPIKDGK